MRYGAVRPLFCYRTKPAACSLSMKPRSALPPATAATASLLGGVKNTFQKAVRPAATAVTAAASTWKRRRSSRRLVEFRFRRSFSAESGKPGGSSNKSGRSGADLTDRGSHRNARLQAATRRQRRFRWRSERGRHAHFGGQGRPRRIRQSALRNERAPSAALCRTR